MVSERQALREWRQERGSDRVARGNRRNGLPLDRASPVGHQSELGVAPPQRQVRAPGVLVARRHGVGVERADAASRGGDRGAFGLDRVLQVGRGRAALHGVARPNGPRVVAGRRGREAGANARGARASRERAGAEHGRGAAERRVRLGDAGVRVGGRDVPSGQGALRGGEEERSGAAVLVLGRLHAVSVGAGELEAAGGAADGASAAGESDGVLAGRAVHRVGVLR